ncbi:MAG: hypothetical protein AAF628_16350 [Planctomycetota bacterium]
MTQLDLPPISFARYLDLLKRRRWQVLPVSLLGLLVGGLVASLIPRYYVARTVIEFQGEVLGSNERSDDPMKDLVDSAQATIVWSVKGALETVKWPEALVDDPDERRAVEELVRSRVNVIDLNPDRGRQTAIVAVEYRDTDGYRAREMANSLVTTWVEERRARMNHEALIQLRRLNEEIQIQNSGLASVEGEIASLLESEGINPLDLGGPTMGGSSALSQQLGDQEKRLEELQGERDELAAEIELLRGEIALVAEEIVTADASKLSDTEQRSLSLLQIQVTRYAAMLGEFRPGHRDRETTQQLYEEASERLLEAQKLLGVDPKPRPNPAFVERQRNLSRLDAQLAGADAKIETAQERLEVLQRQVAALPAVMGQYQLLISQRDTHQSALDEYGKSLRSYRREQELLDREDPYEIRLANVPRRPTTPNITLVALAGCAVGLAFAIGLVLLIDILQSTYKTLSDVERELPVPVLGGLSFMTTDEDRREQTVRRARFGVAAGVFLVLMLSVITLYYVDPTSLPPVVRDTLELLLGSPQAAPTE